MEIIFITSTSLLGLTGFLIASYIYGKKRAKKKLVCPMRSNCDTVIHSDYSKILGIPVEILGMIYYVSISSIYGILYILGLLDITILQIGLGVSGSAVLFSVYLISLQAFVIRHWCTWCLFSGAISLTIFVISYLHLISN